MSGTFWRGKRVWVTGHTGFKGSWLVLLLSEQGAEVFGYALPPPTDPSLFELAHLQERVHHTVGDVRDLQHLSEAMAACSPDVMIHAAAQALVRESYLHPVDTYATNIMGTVHVLEALRAVPSVRAAVFVTSDKCYENREWPWGYREDEAMGGADPYSSSKGCAELIVAAYRRSFFREQGGAACHIASARAGNVIGGGDWARNRLVPDIIAALQQGRPPSIRHPEAIRPWQHVLEPLSGYLLLAERLWREGAPLAEAWNFGPDEADVRPVRWVADRLCALWGGGAHWMPDAAAHPPESRLLKLDASKARMRLGWRPRWGVETALRSVVELHQALQAGQDARALMLRQLRAFQAESCGTSTTPQP